MPLDYVVKSRVIKHAIIIQIGIYHMKEFMKTNTVTHNLMSFTGFKSILIFSLLLESPKTYEDIQKILDSHPYLHESASIDTIRIYINSIKKFGCEVKSITQDRKKYYYIESHPFELKISDEQAESIIKLYKAIAKTIDMQEFMALESFFEKFSKYVTNDTLKAKLQNISPINNIDIELIKDLLKYTKSKSEITVLYNSSHSGKKNITILADKLYIRNNKLYLSGVNSEYKNYYSFLVSKIIRIIGVNIEKPTLKFPTYTVKYEWEKSDNTELEILENETIIENLGNKMVIEITSKNKFDIMQRIFSHADKCKVLEPLAFRQEVIENLKKMKEEYFKIDQNK